MTAEYDPESVVEFAEELAALRRQVAVLSTSQQRIENTAERAVRGLDDLEEQLEATAASIVASTGDASPTGDDTDADGTEDEPKRAEPLDMDVLYDWVGENISQWAQRKVPSTAGSGSGFRWCKQWFEHPEAITRLWALRLAWLDAVGQPGGAMAAYFLHVFDPTLSLLGSEVGPFHSCSPMKHTPDQGYLVSEEPPWRST